MCIRDRYGTDKPDLRNPLQIHDITKVFTREDVKFEIFRKTKRCAATNVNPKTGLRDLNIPNQLQKIYGHYDLGVYGRVLNKGTIKINDEIKF